MHAYVFLFIIHTYILAFIIQIEIYWKQSGQSTAGSCYISLEPPPPSSIAVINVESDSLIVDTAEKLHETFTQVHNLLINWVAPESPNAKLSDLQYLIYVGIDESPPVNENSVYIHAVENVTLQNEVNILPLHSCHVY